MEDAEHTGLITTRLTRLWGIDRPIIGAPMAGRSGGRLAAAVSAAGGLGMFGVGDATPPNWILDQAAIAAEAGKPYGIGLMVWALEEHPEQFEAVLEAAPAVVSLGFGDPAPYVDRAHAAGISVVAPINDMTQLRQALDAGVDAICVQGTDAGGHTGHLGTMPLMQMVLSYMAVHAPGIPAAVAGGIGNGRGLAAVLAAGADAAWVGTALLASPESEGSDAHRAAIVKANSADTLLTDIYDRAEQKAWNTKLWPTRTLRNGFTDAFAEDAEMGHVTDAELVQARGEDGDFAIDLKVHAGQGVSMVLSESPAGEVVRVMSVEAHRLFQRMNAWG